MPKITTVDNDSIVLWVDTDSKVVGHELRKYPSSEALRDALNAGVELFKKHGATKWLSDDRKGGALPQDFLDWSAANWKPRVISAGWKHWALILPLKIGGQLSMKRLVENYAKAGVTVQIFTEPDEGMKWLNSV